MDPNEEFRKRKGYDKFSSGRAYDSPRPYPTALLIRCDNCGYKVTVPRTVWLGKREIECPECMETNYWSPL